MLAAALSAVAFGLPVAALPGTSEPADAPRSAGTSEPAAAPPLAGTSEVRSGSDPGRAPGQVLDPARGRLLVRWADGASPAERTAVVAAVLPEELMAARRRVSTRVDALELGDPGDLDALAARLRARTEVLLVERDRVLESRTAAAEAPAPDDPLFVQQWGLRNLGSALGPSGQLEPGTAGLDIGLLDAWSVTRGVPEVTVAVIDTVVDVDHRDLAGAVIAQSSTLGADGLPAVHGTAVAGIIGARAGDAFGVAGVAPEVSLVSAAAFRPASDAQEPGGATLGSVLVAFDAAMAAGVDVINASWVTSDPSPLLREAIASSGVPVVAASGNDGFLLTDASDVYPIGFALPNVVAVTAIDRAGLVAAFANVGPDVVDVAAPGVQVLVSGPDDQHVWADGTSFAAPHVTGAIALAKSAAPYATTGELVDAVSWTSRVVPGLRSSTRTGGMLDAGALVRGVQRPVCRPDRLPAAGFSDVLETDVHASAIGCLAANGITTGRADGTYGASAEVTREQMASLLFRVLVERGFSPDAPSAGFVDVAADSVHAPAIDRLSDLDIVFGDAQGRFRPRETVTRGQVASLLVRTHEAVHGATAPPTRSWFDDTASSVHTPTIDRARDLGIVRGVTRVSFDPGAPTRRGQMASFVARALDALARATEGAP